MIRIGIGHDIHKLVEGRELWLGGINIPYEKGLLGHSDADALIHAIMDAMLGALALGDIGQYFPDTDPKYKGISSLKLLEYVCSLIAAKGWKLVNLDCIIHCERPKILPHREKMRTVLAKALNTKIDNISIKAGTNEGLDAVGRKEAISCDAAVLLADNL